MIGWIVAAVLLCVVLGLACWGLRANKRSIKQMRLADIARRAQERPYTDAGS
jgi:hypothetical protein